MQITIFSHFGRKLRFLGEKNVKPGLTLTPIPVGRGSPTPFPSHPFHFAFCGFVFAYFLGQIFLCCGEEGGGGSPPPHQIPVQPETHAPSHPAPTGNNSVLWRGWIDGVSFAEPILFCVEEEGMAIFVM